MSGPATPPPARLSPDATSATGESAALTVRPISRSVLDEATTMIAEVSHLQQGWWADVRREWKPLFLGWFGSDGRLVGTGLVLLRRLPLGLGSWAYLAEGPVFDCMDTSPGAWLPPLVTALRQHRAAVITMSPPITARCWSSATVSAALSRGDVAQISDLSPDEVDPEITDFLSSMTDLGWRPARPDGPTGWSRYTYEVPLADQTSESLYRGLRKSSRRRITGARDAGVKIVRGAASDVDEFYGVYRETSVRQGFPGLPRPFFDRLFAVMSKHPDLLRVHFARLDGQTLAATLTHCHGLRFSALFGGTSRSHPRIHPGAALDWAVITEALREGAQVYDLRGIASELAPGHPKRGILEYKLGLPGRIVEHVGEFEWARSRLLLAALHGFWRARTAVRGLVRRRMEPVLRRASPADASATHDRAP